MKTERGNGANVIVLNSNSEILVVQQNYGENKWMLPGGEVERGESPRHAAQEETEEETGIIIDEKQLRLISVLVQRPNGLVCLYETKEFHGCPISEPSAEILKVAFMSFQKIIDHGEAFGLGYRRMIIRYKRCIHGLDHIPSEGRLADRVEYPKSLDAEFDGIILQV